MVYFAERPPVSVQRIRSIKPYEAGNEDGLTQDIFSIRELIKKSDEYETLSEPNKLIVILVACDAVLELGQKAISISSRELTKELLRMIKVVLAKAHDHGPEFDTLPSAMQNKVDRTIAFSVFLKAWLSKNE